MTREDIFKRALTFAAETTRPVTTIAFAQALTEFANGIVNSSKKAKDEQAEAIFNSARGGSKL